MANTIMKFSLFALLTGATVGCSYYARSPEDYRDATQAVLDTKSQDIKACYDSALKGQPELQGRVTVQFGVEAETGRVKDVKVDPAGTQAPETLSACVVNALNGLALTPPDKREGVATWVYDFQAQAGTPAAPPAG